MLRNAITLLWRIFHYFLIYSTLIISLVILNDILYNVRLLWLKQQPIRLPPFIDFPSPLSPDVWKALPPIVDDQSVNDRPPDNNNVPFFWTSFGASAVREDRRLYDLFLRPQFHLDRKYARFSRTEKEQMRRQAKDMFSHAYRGYLTHAFPDDELNPIDCRGRGPDYANP